MTTLEFKTALTASIAESAKVLALGQCGDINTPLIPGQSDIDMFALCAEIPTADERRALYAPLAGKYESLEMAVCEGGIWGTGDILVCGGVEVMPMYFTLSEMEDYIKSVLAGEHLLREGRFYPVGRLASVEGINVLFEKGGEWSRLKAKVAARPQPLFIKSFACHSAAAIDVEDIGRVRLRRELLFAHQVFEEGIDHLLQAIFALNAHYFPSRKRTLKYLEIFTIKPANCQSRLLKVLRDAADENGVLAAADEFEALCAETAALGREKFGV